jgi:hypothetical protein
MVEGTSLIPRRREAAIADEASSVLALEGVHRALARLA